MDLIEYDAFSKLGVVILSGLNVIPLIKYARDNKIKHIFYRYLYSYKKDFLIDMEHATGSIYTVAREEILSYNQNIHQLNFDTPSYLEVFCLHNGICIMMEFEAPWIEGLPKKDDYLEMLKQEYTELLNV